MGRKPDIHLLLWLPFSSSAVAQFETVAETCIFTESNGCSERFMIFCLVCRNLAEWRTVSFFLFKKINSIWKVAASINDLFVRLQVWFADKKIKVCKCSAVWQPMWTSPDVVFLHHHMYAVKMFWLKNDNRLMAGIPDLNHYQNWINLPSATCPANFSQLHLQVFVVTQTNKINREVQTFIATNSLADVTMMFFVIKLFSSQ